MLAAILEKKGTGVILAVLAVACGDGHEGGGHNPSRFSPRLLSSTPGPATLNKRVTPEVLSQ